MQNNGREKMKLWVNLFLLWCSKNIATSALSPEYVACTYTSAYQGPSIQNTPPRCHECALRFGSEALLLLSQQLVSQTEPIEYLKYQSISVRNSFILWFNFFRTSLWYGFPYLTEFTPTHHRKLWLWRSFWPNDSHTVQYASKCARKLAMSCVNCVTAVPVWYFRKGLNQQTSCPLRIWN